MDLNEFFKEHTLVCGMLVNYQKLFALLAVMLMLCGAALALEQRRQEARAAVAVGADRLGGRGFYGQRIKTAPSPLARARAPF